MHASTQWDLRNFYCITLNLITFTYFAPTYNRKIIERVVSNLYAISKNFKGLFTPSKSESEREEGERTIKTDKRISDKHQRKFSLSLSLGVNGF